MGLHCNWQKTKVKNVGAGPAPPPVQMENQLVESVTKFTYLGLDVVSGSSATPEVHRHIGLANSILGQLDGVWRNRRLSLNTKLRFCTSLVQSVLLHGLPWLRCHIRQFIHPEVHRHIGLANSILGQLDRVWRNRRLSLNTKLRLCTSLVQSVLLHGSETWTVTKADSARLQAFHMKAQRHILNIKVA